MFCLVFKVKKESRTTNDRFLQSVWDQPVDRSFDIMLTTHISIFLERIMTDILEDHEGTVSIGGSTMTNLRFADDIDGLAGEEEELATLVERSTKPPQPTAWRSEPRRLI